MLWFGANQGLSQLKENTAPNDPMLIGTFTQLVHGIFQVIEKKGWLPGMDSNHIIDRFCSSQKLLILQSH
jgi:hypothetical protein